jgi:hypothetical protein
MASTREEEKPWKTDLARKSALRRESVLHEVEEAIKKASSFEDALKQSVEIMKKRFGRYSAITAYVADGEDLAVHTSLERPAGPDRIWSGGGPWPTPPTVTSRPRSPTWPRSPSGPPSAWPRAA